MFRFFLKQNVTVFVLLPSVQTLSGLELVENWKSALCVKKEVVIKLLSFGVFLIETQLICALFLEVIKWWKLVFAFQSIKISKWKDDLE